MTLSDERIDFLADCFSSWDLVSGDISFGEIQAMAFEIREYRKTREIPIPEPRMPRTGSHKPLV